MVLHFMRIRKPDDEIERYYQFVLSFWNAMKDNILKKYDIPFLRLATNGSQERKKIEEKLRK